MSFSAPPSMAEKIAGHLASQIIRGELSALDRIQESRVVNELDVSRGSVREALLLLEKRHLVEMYPRRGAVVAEVTADTVRNLFDVFDVLLVHLITRLAEQWKDNELEPLVYQLNRIQQMADQKDRRSFMEAVFRLMRMTYPIVANRYLEEIIGDMEPVIHRFYAMAQRFQPNTDAAKAALPFFTGLLEAVTERNIGRIPALVAQYIDHEADHVLAAAEQQSKK